MNFVADVVATAPPDTLALIDRPAGGGRTEHRFGPLVERSLRLAATYRRRGVNRGDVVLLLAGNRVEWVEAMLAAFAIGAVALPCAVALRRNDVAARIAATTPALIVAEEELAHLAADATCPVLVTNDPARYDAEPSACIDLAADDPCLLTFTSGSSGAPKAVLHAQRYLFGQRLQARHWLGARPGDVVWCTAATGWSKSARNSFVAAWLAGATAVVHAGRFDADERLAIAVEEKVSVWCMAPTEYRLLARRTALRGWPALRELVAAGEALDVATLETIRAATGLDVRDGYGQTETGQLTANPAGHPVRPGSMGRPLPGVRAWVADGELVVDPASVPTFFLGYRGEPPPRGPWHTGDLVHADADGYLYADGRADDVIISAGYRIGPTEVEQALAAHPAVAAVAVVPAPDEIRGSIVRAVVVLHDGWVGQAALTEELQAYVRATRAPHTYPRRIDYVADLPRTATGKVDRAALRDDGHPGRN